MAAYLGGELGVRDGATRSASAITWHSTIECLCACAGAPMMEVGRRFEENLTPERIDAIIERLRTDPLPGPPHKGEGVEAPTPNKGEDVAQPKKPARPRARKN